MKGKIHTKSVLFVVTILALSAFSCNLASVAARPSTPTPPPVAVSTQAVNDLVNNVENAAATAVSGGSTTLTITESQLTSLAVLALQEQQQFQINNLQIRLHDGQIQISGQVVQGNLELPLSVALTVSVDSQGLPQSQIVSAKLGPLPLPQPILDQFTSQLDQAITSQFNAAGTNLVIDQIMISEGSMAITGHIRQ